MCIRDRPKILHIFHAQRLAIPHAFALGVRRGRVGSSIRSKASGIGSRVISRAVFSHAPVDGVHSFGAYKNPGVTGLFHGLRLAMRRCAER